VGLGGTGSYILDLVAKTPVAEIHLYDGDKFLQHNAFRSPGAVSREELEETPNKADHFAAVYGRMHPGVIAHPVYVDETNAETLRKADFVFLWWTTIPRADGSSRNSSGTRWRSSTWGWACTRLTDNCPAW
jgi:tRNA A37 threonylcarbamoyladenosine dehydratase